jgi:hypothetical protein
VFAGDDIEHLPELVNRPIKIDPPARDLHMCFVHEPPVTGTVPARPGGIDKQRSEPHHPPVDRDVIDGDAAFGE